MDLILYIFLFGALLIISVIDLKSKRIPLPANIFLFLLGIVRVLTDLSNWSDYLLGFFCMGLFLYLFCFVTKEQGLGGGDVKLMAACGLILGLEPVFVALFIGGILGILFYLLRKLVTGKSSVLALGPCLSIGIMVCVLWGKQLF